MKERFKSNIKDIVSGIIALAFVFMTGCSLDSTPGMGTLEVRLHDAPVNYEEVNVFIERVEVNRSDSENGWVVVSEPNESYNILELTNGNFEVLADVELEEGLYRQIRLILSRDNNSVVIDGEKSGLFVPSGAQTGIKINVDAEIREGIRYVLLLDFDAKRSVVKTGQAQFPGFLLKPVIRASNEAVTGNIGGVITPFDANAVVYAIAGDDTLSTTFADSLNGEFLLVGLEEGLYDVSVEPREEGYAAASIDGVEVEVGVTTDLGTISLDEE
jgi:hypothetical protein